MCERSILRARRKQHFHSLAHIQHVRVAREVAREIQCHGSIDMCKWFSWWTWFDGCSSVFCDHCSKSLNLVLPCVIGLVCGLDECNSTLTCDV